MKLLSMRLTNFKGIRGANFDFPDGGNYNIYGANATGKSTTFDALTWLLFDKDSLDTKDFTIKTMVNGEPLHHAEHSVECAFLMEGGLRVTLKKVFKEKWQRPRGKLEAEFAGHTTAYFINEVPTSASEYKKYISGIIDEKKFKTLTNPLYFNENLKDTDRRAVLMDIIGGVDQDVIIAENIAELKDLKPLLNGRKVEDFRLVVKQSLARTKKEIDGIEPAIKEHQAMMITGADAANTGLYENTIQRCTEEIETIIREIARVKAGTVSTELEAKKAELNKQFWQVSQEADKARMEEQRALKQKQQEAYKELVSAENILSGLEKVIKEHEHIILGCEQKREILVRQFNAASQQKFNAEPIETICPMCGQEIQPEKVEAAKAAQAEQERKFNLKRAEMLKSINTEGKKNNEVKETAEAHLKEAKQNRNKAQADVDAALAKEKEAIRNVAEFNPGLTPEEERLKNEIAALDAQANRPDEAAEKRIAELEEARQAEIAKRKEAQDKVNEIEQNRKHQARIRELQEKETELSGTFTELTRQQYLCDQYSRALTDHIDRAVADKFQMAKFVMFKDNITNEGAKECCEVVVNGVPYHDLNNACKMNIGLDIINTLCKHYGVTVPVFIDNAESVTDLIKTDLQIIRLVVSADDKKLRVEKA